MALMSYLIRDHYGTYYFRRVVPVALRVFMPEPWVGLVNYKHSLGTKDPKIAKREGSKALRACVVAFEFAERAMKGGGKALTSAPSHDSLSLEDIEADIMSELLAADELERRDGDARRHHQTREERSAWPDLEPVAFGRKGMAGDYEDAYAMQLEMLHQDYCAAYGRRDPQIVDAELRTYLKRHRFPIDPTSPDYYERGLAVLRAHVEAYRLMLARSAGEIVAPSSLRVEKGLRLSEAFTQWKAGGSAKGARKPNTGSIREAEYGCRRFIEWHGDLRLGDIDKAKARDFRDALAKTCIRLKGGLQKLPLRALLANPDLAKFPPVSATTVNKTMNLLGAVVSFAIREGRTDNIPHFVNPFQGIKLSVDARAVEKRDIFDIADLRAIFGTEVYLAGKRPLGGGGEAAFWLPLIALFTGARQEEIAQLRVQDLRQDLETGSWFFAIGGDDARTVKNVGSLRKVPVHPHLVEIGLLRYHQTLKAGGDLWPDIKSNRKGNRRAVAWSQWFTRFLREDAKVTEANKVFHSFRHTFIRMARDAGLTEEQHDALTGHSGGGVGRTYGGGFGLKALAEAMGKIGISPSTIDLRWLPAKLT